MKLLPFLVLHSFLQLLVDGVEYGPSISSLTGVFVNWKGPDILALEKKVLLGRYPGFSVSLPLISGYSEATSEQIFKERGISTVGEFTVEAPKGFGIIAVIQELKFRKTTRDRGNQNATLGCSDYIQFGDTWSEDSGLPTTVSDKICGTVLRDDLNVNPKGLLGPRTFRSPSGRLSVAFNHAYVAELVYSLLGSKQKHVLKAELTFTAYSTNCSDVENSMSNSTSETFKVCSDYKSSSNLTCINSKLFCDLEIYNCGGDDELLGSDENSESCPDRPVRTTEISLPPEDNVDVEDKQSGLSDLSTYLGIPSLSSYTTKKYERKFRPSYVSGSSPPPSGFLYDYRASRRPSAIPVHLSTTQPSPTGGSFIEISVLGPTRKSSTFEGNLHSSKTHDSSEFENEIYSRRELSHAINSVIYGVAVFIIFTIFITVFVVCITKKIQTTWTARHEERLGESAIDAGPNPNNSDSTIRRRVSTPGILSGATTLTVPNGDIRRHSDCYHGPRGVPDSVEVVVVPDEDMDGNDLPPPSYSSLFPIN